MNPHRLPRVAPAPSRDFGGRFVTIGARVRVPGTDPAYYASKTIVLDTATGRGRAFSWAHAAREAAERWNDDPRAVSARMSRRHGEAALESLRELASQGGASAELADSILSRVTTEGA